MKRKDIYLCCTKRISLIPAAVTFISAAVLLLFCFSSLRGQEIPSSPADTKDLQKTPATPDTSSQKNNYVPVITDTPRDTMRTFMEAMNDYRKGVDKEDKEDDELQNRLKDAIRTLHLKKQDSIFQIQGGEEEAILLKEIIDRTFKVNYEAIPEKNDMDRWRLPKTEIVIQKEREGERAGEYLFSASTVDQLAAIYERVEGLEYLPHLDKSEQGAFYDDYKGGAHWLKQYIPSALQQTLLSLHWWQWGGIFGVILAGFVLMLLLRLAFGMLRALLRRTASFWIEKFLQSIQRPFIYIVGIGFWFSCLVVLRIQGPVSNFITVLLRLLLSAAIIWLAYRSTDVLSSYLRQMALKTKSNLDDLLVPLLSRSLKVFVVAIGALLAIQNMGINIFSLVAGLGLGGLALALAAKDTMANLFGSFMIAFDRPFQIGDWVKMGDYEGTVEEIGFRSTRIRTFYNSLVAIPNSDVATCGIDNMGARRYRRVVARLSVTYDTSPEKMDLFIDGIKNIIATHPSTRKDYYHVVFNEYGDSGLIVLVYFFLEVPDWTRELIEKQNVFMLILRLAADTGVDFAFPTRTLHLAGLPEGENPFSTAEKLEKIVT